MPKYTLRDIKNDQEWDIWCTYEELQETLDNMPDVINVIGAPMIVTQAGSTLSRTSSDWRNHLDKIKKANPGSKVNS
jgi:hypothetical protein